MKKEEMMRGRIGISKIICEIKNLWIISFYQIYMIKLYFKYLAYSLLKYYVLKEKVFLKIFCDMISLLKYHK